MRRLLLALLAAALAFAAAAGAVPPPQGVVHVKRRPRVALKEWGAELFAANCASCHGLHGQGIVEPRPGGGGVKGRGPSLRKVGAGAADFYLRIGAMPISDPDAQPLRSRVLFGDAEIRAIDAFVASLGSGPGIPTPHPARGSLSEGMQLFADHCAGCHQIDARGGIVTGAAVPALTSSTPREIAEAVRMGPYLMPRFARSQISDAQLNSLIAYVQRAKRPLDAGGWGIGHVGPVPEGIVAWFVAAGVLVAVATLLGSRLRR